MFSSWFNHTIKATIAARIWQVQEYDDARILACSREHLPTNQSKWVKCLAPSTWKSTTPPRLSASIGLNYGHYNIFFLTQAQVQPSQLNPFIYPKILKVVSKIGWNKSKSIYSFTSDQTSKGRSFQLASCQPLLSAQRTKLKWWPTLINVFWVQHEEGEYITFLHRELLSKSEDTGVETANEGRFSSHSEWVDGVDHFELTH